MTLLFLLIVSVVGGLVYAMNTGRLQIKEVSVEGVSPPLAERMEDEATRFLAGSYFGIVPKQNVLLYPKSSLLAHVADTFPRLEELGVELDIFSTQTLYIQAKERREDGLWCTQDEEQECYFIDKTGYVFAHAPQYSEGVMFVYYGDIEGDPLRQQYITQDAFTRLGAFIRAFETHPEFESVIPIALEALPDDEYKLYLTGGSYVLFNDSYGLENAFQNIVVALNKDVFELHSVQYVDIRLPDKIFYKNFDMSQTES